MKEIFYSYVNAVNAGDINTAMALMSADARLANSRYRPLKPAEGLDLIKAYISETVIEQQGQIKPLSVKENGNTIEAYVELKSSRIATAGCRRILGTEKFRIENNKIAAFEFAMDIADSETKTFLEFVKSLEAKRVT